MPEWIIYISIFQGSDKDDEDAEKIDEELMDEEDEELDEGTDYANNFFDNGENYLDDDEDNLDEGGIYWKINTLCLLSLKSLIAFGNIFHIYLVSTCPRNFKMHEVTDHTVTVCFIILYPPRFFLEIRVIIKILKNP